MASKNAEKKIEKAVEEKTKKVVETAVETEKQDENLKSKELEKRMEQLEEESKKKDLQITQLLETLKMQTYVTNDKPQVQFTTEDIVYVIKTDALMGIDLMSLNGDTNVDVPFNEEVDVSQHDLREIFKKKSNKKLFENDIIRFVKQDDEDALDPNEVFRIKKRKDLSDENIIRILGIEDAQKMYAELNELTDLRKNDVVTHTLFNKICFLENNHMLELPRIKYEEIERFFKAPLSVGITNLNVVSNLRL